MIYFDENKNASNTEFPIYIACVDDETWHLHEHKDDWDIIDGEFVDLSGSEIILEKEKEQRKTQFYKDFIKTSLGCIRLKTKVGDFISILPNLTFQVQTLQKLPANTIIFYVEPDFSQEITEKSLVENSYKNNEMTLVDYQKFYMEVMSEIQRIFNS